ncbi:MAG: hypothetical protein ACR2JF_02535 [Iamia sp.]
MAGKSRPSAEKRRIDKERQEKQAAKRERRHNRESDGSQEEVNTEEIMERFRVLSEAHAAGKVSDEEFGPARHELMVALGVEDPVDTPADADD